MAKPNYTDRLLKVADQDIPIRIYLEVRNSVRISLGKDYVIMRFPKSQASDLEKHVTKAIVWLNEVHTKKPNALNKYSIKKYDSELTITVLGRHHHPVIVIPEERTNGIAQFENGPAITVKIPLKITPHSKKIMIRTLLSRLIAKVYKPYVVDRVAYWNVMKFGNKTIKGVSLKYNATNWGSCSSKGRINISTKSLLLSQEAFDYLIVHELSHMVEMNHSPRFWKVVADAMPDYKAQEAWISKHGSKLDF